jgi:hypothetical protein
MLALDPRRIIEHLRGGANTCGSCHISLNWWDITRSAITENFMGNEALGFVGAMSTYFSLELNPNERTIYKFSEHGIPTNARVLYINYTPQGGTLFPLEFHGNVPTRRFLRDEVVLFPVAFAKGETPTRTPVSVLITWIPHGESDDAWQNLSDAFDAYIADKYNAVIVPANVAVESSLLSLMTTYLDAAASRKRVDEFLTSAATYGHQLNVLLPVFAQLKNYPPLPAQIVGLLNRLRGLRNDLAHGGATEKPLAKSEVADLLAAAVFGFHYLRHLHAQARDERTA